MRQTKLLHIFEMLLICGLGLTLVLYPRKSWETALVILGFALLAGGIIAVGYYLLILRKRENPDQSAMMVCIAGLVAAALGVIIIVKPSLFNRLFQAAAGILVAFSGILNLVKAIDMKKDGGKGWPVLLVLSLITIALGVLIFINPFTAQKTLVILVGCVLIYNGVLGIVTAIQE